MIAGSQLITASSNNTPNFNAFHRSSNPSPSHTPGRNGSPHRAPSRSRAVAARTSISTTMKTASHNINVIADQDKRRQRWSTVLAVSALVSVVLMIVNLEVRWNRPLDPAAERACDALKALISALVLVSEFALVMYYKADLQLSVARCLLPESATVLTAGGFGQLLAEAAVLAVHPPPRVFLVGADQYNLENLLSVLMFLRLYLVFRVVSGASELLSPAGRLITSITNATVSPWMVVKTALFLHPMRSLVLAFLVLCSTSSYCVFVFERWSALATPTTIDDDREHFANIIWMMLITIFTVGYGDMYPLTHEGRVVCIISSFLGAVTTALLIAVVHGQLQLSSQEIKIVSFLSRDRYRREVRDAAAICVQAAWRWHRRRRGRSRAYRPRPAGEKVHSADGSENSGLTDEASVLSSAGVFADAHFFKSLSRWRELKRALANMMNDEDTQYRLLMEQIFAGIQSITTRLDLVGVPREDPRAAPPGMAFLNRRANASFKVAGAAGPPTRPGSGRSSKPAPARAAGRQAGGERAADRAPSPPPAPATTLQTLFAAAATGEPAPPTPDLPPARHLPSLQAGAGASKLPSARSNGGASEAGEDAPAPRAAGATVHPLPAPVVYAVPEVQHA